MDGRAFVRAETNEVVQQPNKHPGDFSTRIQVNNLDYSYVLRDITDMFNVTSYCTCTRE